MQQSWQLWKDQCHKAHKLQDAMKFHKCDQLTAKVQALCNQRRQLIQQNAAHFDIDIVNFVNVTPTSTLCKWYNKAKGCFCNSLQSAKIQALLEHETHTIASKPDN